MRSLRIAVIVGSTRRGRNTPRLARFIHRKLQEDPRAEPELIDLAEYDLPMMEERLRFLENPPARLVDFARSIDRADAIVIATPEYNQGIPGVLKNAIDYLDAQYRRKPVGIVTHSVGAFGGNVVLHPLRMVMLNLGAVPIPATLKVPHIREALDEDGNAVQEEFEGRGERFVKDLVWYAEALRRQRDAGAEVSE